MTRTPEEIIRQRRRQCLCHRLLYYVYDEPIVSDHQYTQWENELKTLTLKYPEIASKVEFSSHCPSVTVGSDDIRWYPLEIIRIAEFIRSYHKEVVKGNGNVY